MLESQRINRNAAPVDPAAINCQDCQHAYITHEAKMPYGCRLFGFKSARWPSIVVKQQSGEECTGFELKPSPGSKDNDGSWRPAAK